MPPISLAFFWHQHQPYYPDDLTGENLFPWVRLHSTKSYYGMALHIKEVPEFRCTVNLVPSLLEQILNYTDRGASDKHLTLCRKNADSLTEEETLYLLRQCFMVNVDNMVRPYQRYNELYHKRAFGSQRAEQALQRFNVQDMRDLQVWNNLTWFHPLIFQQDNELAAFRDKGQGWTESEKNWLLDRQLHYMKKVITLHRELVQGGQLEITTTPFYHPILPLLWDKKCARQAMPQVKLPKYLTPYPEDALWQIQQGVKFHTELFGQPPTGMWPSEGSVSQEIIAEIADAGIKWIATDEEILSASTGGRVSRDHQGHIRHPELLFRPWRLEEAGRELQIVFRDHALSDLVGFHYQRYDPVHAAYDLLGKVEAIGRAVTPHNNGRPALVPVILDGENCWEYYPDGGVTFLRTLYRQAVKNPHLRPIKMIEHIEEHPATDRIGTLFAGSWINHNFAIWIGHREDVTGWERLHETRDFLKKIEAAGQTDPANLKKAWRELYIAEGSDWFWWFGDDHNSAQDDMFDRLFRQHLKNVYIALGHRPPASLDTPITQTVNRVIHTQPTGFIRPRITGRCSYFEWLAAAHYKSGSERGTMTMVTEGVIRDVWFGFDAERLYVRADTAGAACDDFSATKAVVVHFLEPSQTEIIVTNPGGRPEGKLMIQGKPVAADVQVGVQSVLELSAPFDALRIKPGDPVHFFLELHDAKGQSADRSPSEGTLELQRPAPDFEAKIWLA